MKKPAVPQLRSSLPWFLLSTSLKYQSLRHWLPPRPSHISKREHLTDTNTAVLNCDPPQQIPAFFGADKDIFQSYQRDGRSKFLHLQQQVHIAGATAGTATNLHHQEPKNFDTDSCEQGAKNPQKPNNLQMHFREELYLDSSSGLQLNVLSSNEMASSRPWVQPGAMRCAWEETSLTQSTFYLRQGECSTPYT